MRQLLINTVRGFLMGAADIVPGVSGGTIALVVGIYERFVASIKAGSSALYRFVRFQFAEGVEWLRRVEWSLIVPLGVGILLAVVLLAQVIQTQLHDRPVQMAALFLGLVAGSAVVAWGMLRDRDAIRLVIIFTTGVVVFLLLGLRQGTSDETVNQLADPALWAFLASGAIAIWAMVLPGVSGSFLLVVMGMYGPVLGAVNERDFAALGVFIVGAVVGLALFAQVLHRALSRYHDTVMAALIGLMLGSLRVLWPWPDGVNSTVLGRPDEAVAISIAIALGAFLAVLAINEVARRTDHQPLSDAPAPLEKPQP